MITAILASIALIIETIFAAILMGIVYRKRNKRED